MAHYHYLEMLICQEAKGDVVYEQQLREEVFDHWQGDGPDFDNLSETAKAIIVDYENYCIHAIERGM